MTVATEKKMTAAESFCVIAVTIPLAILRGWVLAVMAGWFLVPLGVPRFGTWVGAGLLSIAALVRGYSDTDTDDDLESNVRKVLMGVVMALVALGFGFLWHQAAA